MDISSNWRKYLEEASDESGNSRDRVRCKTPKMRVNKKSNLSNKQEKLRFSSGRDHSTEREKSITEAVALDCEMVGVQDGVESILARVSIVNSYGHCLYDTFVKPTENVVDYRTCVSGVRPKDMENGVEFHVAQKTVADLLKGRILVGHALKNDLQVLYISHPRWKIRDTSKYKPFRAVTKGKTPSLKKLAKEILDVKLQVGEHSSVEDARAAMQLYNLHKKQWEHDKFKKKS